VNVLIVVSALFVVLAVRIVNQFSLKHVSPESQTC
jgi:hypothetical protein